MEGQPLYAAWQLLYKVCDELGPHLWKWSNVVRSPGKVEQQIAATLYYLLDEGQLRKTANAVGLSRGSVLIIIRRVSKAIPLAKGSKYIKLPLTEEDVGEKVSKFNRMFSFP